MMWWLPLILQRRTPPSRAHSPPGCPAPRELVASGYVADGNRQLVWNPEFCQPAVKRLAEVSDSLFWSLPLAVSTAARQRRVGGPPASFILFHGVRHVHNTVHNPILPTAHPVGAENLVQSSDQAVFVDQAAGVRVSSDTLTPVYPIRIVGCHADHELADRG